VTAPQAFVIFIIGVESRRHLPKLYRTGPAQRALFHLYAIYPEIWEGDRTSSRKGWAEVTKFFLQAYTLFYHPWFNGFKDRWGSGSLERGHVRIRCYSMLARALEAS
jgi:hypothetical protein